MLPGKKYAVEDIVRILRRRFWLLVVPFALVSAAVAVYARLLPDVFRSETLILVVPQRIPESYVKSTVTARIEDRLQSITQQILSRTRLERIITDFNLYEAERKTMIMEDIVGRMRTRDVDVQIVKGDAFRVSFTGSHPRTVMRVTDRLASLFIEENLREREVQAEGTNQFLEAQLEDARRRLVEHEKKLEEYRKTHSGALPTQLDSNLQAITNTEMQIQSIVESLNRDRDRRLVIERQIADVEALPRDDEAATPVPGGAVGTTRQRLEAARAQYKQLEQRFKPGHPDLAIARRALRDLEERAAEEHADAPAGDVKRPASPVEAARLRRSQDLKAELEQLDRHIAAKQKEEVRLRHVGAQYQQRVEQTPTRESEMTELTRDYDTLRAMYGNLLSKREDSKIAANLERRQIGEQFKLLDPARLPERPFSPNREQLNMVGMAAGLAIGLVLVALLELRDASLKTDDEVVTMLGLPVLAVIPMMLSKAERQRRLRQQVLLGIGLGTTVTACLAVLAYTFVR